jgi:hypothetical protein
MRKCLTVLGALLEALILYCAPTAAQSKISGAPSNAPPRVTDVTDHAESIGDKVEVVFENINLVANYLREEKIRNRLEDYLNQIGAKPTAGEVHIFHVQALMNDTNVVDLKDFQYLTNGKTSEDALRESFAIEGAPGNEDRLYGVPQGSRLVGIYVTATPEGGKFAIRGGTLSKEYYQKIRQEGLALRDKRAKERAEAERIESIRQQRAATHAASDPAAHAQLKRDISRGPLPPGPALFPSGPPAMSSPTTYLPPTRSGPQTTVTPMAPSPAAHPPVPFNQPASPPNPGPAPVKVDPLR